MNSNESVYRLLQNLNFSGSKSELRREYQNLFVVVKPQGSRFGDDVFLNFGIIYKPFVMGKTPKLKDCQLTFRYRNLLQALKKEDYKLTVDDAYHLPEFSYTLEQNYLEHLEKFIIDMDNLSEMKANFPGNIPVLKSDEEDVDHITVVDYLRAKTKLTEFFTNSI
jgi:hypothetical protein